MNSYQYLFHLLRKQKGLGIDDCRLMKNDCGLTILDCRLMIED